MTSITLDLFSGKGRPVSSIPVPVLTLGDYDQRIKAFVKNMRCEKHLFFKRHKVVCRQLFQTKREEGFCFPSSPGRHSPLDLSNRFFFLKDDLRWNFILVFEPEKLRKKIVFAKTSLQFTQENGYPKGVNNVNFFPLSVTYISLLVFEHGHIITRSNGQLFLQGIEVSLLQTLMNQGKSLFLQRKEILVSPNSPLKEKKLNNINSSKLVKVNCFCKEKDFFYSMHIPVLTSKELKEKLKKNVENRLTKYGEKSFRYKNSFVTQFLSGSEKDSSSHLIIFPPGMEVNVPFGPSREGELFFSYSVENTIPSLQMVFFPPLFEEIQSLPTRNPRLKKNWHIESLNPSMIFCIGSKASIYSVSNTSLISCSPFEYKIVGMKIEIVTTKQGGYWGIFCSIEKETASSAGTLVPGPSGVRPHFNEPRKKIARLFPYPQPVATVSIPPDRQGQQAQQKSRVRPYLYGPLPFCGGRFPIIPHSQAAATVSVPPERQGQQTQQRSSPVPVPSGISFHPYSQYGPWPFSGGSHPYFYPGTGFFVGGFYPYGSPFPPYTHPSARQGQWMSGFPTPFSAIRPSVAGLEPLRYDISGQEGVGQSGRVEEASAAVPVGAVQQAHIWSPDEASSSAVVSAKVPLQAETKNSDKDTDIDVEN